MNAVVRPFNDEHGNRAGYHFWCEGCEEYHGVWVEQRNQRTNACWGFNGDLVKPTFTPSILVRGGHYAPGYTGPCWCDYNREHPDDPAPYKCYVCHSFVRDGMIQYLSDCTHHLAGKTVPLKPDED